MVDLEQRAGDGGRHQAAVGDTLAQASDAASEGEFAAALGWLEALGGGIPDDCRIKRQAWTPTLDGSKR